MKKSIMAIALALTIGVIGSGMADARPGMGPGYGMMGGAGTAATADPELLQKRQQFHTETQELRRQMTVKKTELKAALAANNPDEKKAAKLSGELFDLREQLRSKAEAAGITGMGGGDCDGPGSGMMGGRGGRGMMQNRCGGAATTDAQSHNHGQHAAGNGRNI